jgi:hypothetical protein
MDTFVHSLLHAVSTEGSILKVALRLQVEPRTVYFWIAGTEAPDYSARIRVERTFPLRSTGHFI